MTVSAVVDAVAVIVAVVVVVFVVVVAVAVLLLLVVLLLVLLLFDALFVFEWLSLSGAVMMLFLTTWVGLLLAELALGTAGSCDNDDTGTRMRGSTVVLLREGRSRGMVRQ